MPGHVEKVGDVVRSYGRWWVFGMTIGGVARCYDEGSAWGVLEQLPLSLFMFLPFASIYVSFTDYMAMRGTD